MFSEFMTPRDLEVMPTPISRVLLVGGCIFDTWIDTIRRLSPHIHIEHRLFHHAMGPEADLGPYDLRLAQVPLRAVIPEHMTMPLSYLDKGGYEALFQRAVDFLRSHVHSIFEKPASGPTFLLNYMVPQQNPLGRLMPRYDLRNQVFFVEELNRALYDIAAGVPDCHILDIGQISSSIGRQFFQDDPFCLLAHGGFVSDYDYSLDKGRLIPSQPLSQRFDFAVREAVECFWNEATAMYRTLRATDRVKMLCIDLDDTLWRGVMAEQEEVDPVALEGWPIGLAEALVTLRNRGIILAIVSKNDEARIAEIWPQLFSGKLKLEDFAIRKIGWRPKALAVAEAIEEANVLPDTVVFLDDNPVERAQIKAEHPKVRVIDAPHMDWRRILLWSPEMQVETVTEESANRNEMIQAQVQREQARATMNHGDFLRELELRIELNLIDHAGHPQFERALELVNKTNQFNTTGRRWTAIEAGEFLAHSGRWITFRVSDRYTNYGLVGVLSIRDNVIEQFVMSCRVFGLGVEFAVLATLAADRPLSGHLSETPKNGPCRRVYEDAGWYFDGQAWQSGGATKPCPDYIAIVARPAWPEVSSAA